MRKHTSGSQAEGRSSNKAYDRGLRFLTGGLAGGTLLVAVVSLVVDDWSYLTRWMSGLATVVLVVAIVTGKKWFVGRALRLLLQQSKDDASRTENPEAGPDHGQRHAAELAVFVLRRWTEKQ